MRVEQIQGRADRSSNTATLLALLIIPSLHSSSHPPCTPHHTPPTHTHTQIPTYPPPPPPPPPTPSTPPPHTCSTLSSPRQLWDSSSMVTERHRLSAGSRASRPTTSRGARGAAQQLGSEVGQAGLQAEHWKQGKQACTGARAGGEGREHRYAWLKQLKLEYVFIYNCIFQYSYYTVCESRHIH